LLSVTTRRPERTREAGFSTWVVGQSLYTPHMSVVTSIVCVDWNNSSQIRDHLDYELDLTQPVPFPDGAFETIVLSDVLEHVPTPEFVRMEMVRVLSENGRIIMNTPRRAITASIPSCAAALRK
jgi:SAM-dependent methyltransferase